MCVFLPWAKERGVPTHPDAWYVGRSDCTVDLILPYVSKTDAYWRYYEDWYDAVVVNALAEKGESQKAIELASQEEKPDTTTEKKVLLRLARGRAYAQMGQFDKALADLDKAIQLEARNEDAHICRGCLYLQHRQYSKAIADFRRSDSDQSEQCADIFVAGRRLWVERKPRQSDR